ncbi:MAG: hypothetical protein ACI8ZM_001438 [Crocinitomix sp.]|jgi:hypothetical protein
MKKYYYLLTLLFSSASLFAQDFASLYQSHNVDESIVVRDLVVTSDDNILAGYDITGADNIPSAGIMKLDADGEVIWSNKLEITESVAGCTFEVLENSDGNYYLWGLSKEIVTGNMRAILSEMTPDGELLWSKEYDFGWNVVYAYTVNKLSILPSGEMQMMIAVFGKVIVMQTDAEGNIIWGKQSSIGPPDDGGKNPGFEWLAIPDDGGMCASKAENDFSLLRYGPTGDLLWSKRYVLAGYTHGKTIKRSPNGNLLVGGFIAFRPTIMEISDEDGSINWIKQYSGPNMGYGSMALLNIIGDEIIFDYSSADFDHYILKLDIDGNALNTFKTKTKVLDYNKLELIDANSGYFYGSFFKESSEGLIYKSDNLFKESCIISSITNFTSSETFIGSETPFDPTQTDFTNEEDISITLIDQPIIVTDACGIFSGIAEEKAALISIYPNPSANAFTLNVTAELVQSNYVITDLTGKVVATQLINSENELVDISHLNNGHYLLTVFGENITLTEKITVLK